MDAIFGLAQINAVAAALWKEGKKHPVWAFHAPMGSGKTTFIHALCRVIGVETAVSSPTFAIINDYLSRDAGLIHHMDWYRLKNEEEAIQAGVEDVLNSGETCLVEWPGQAEGLLPDNTLHIRIEILDEQTRRISTFNPRDQAEDAMTAEDDSAHPINLDA
ncbi:MAG: tRNA (adenosine(37)-N6)-threonylcarbamoyltransferase complex ATPase subunit type 1 TsaE [Sphingobacteriia bacterium]|nr:tRNA (adenosine(37)-N6)-threonylcarbamoyltransferase complex ATPase subunit type 1 TsaE [Sphingobacteriia bacterium]